MAEGKGWSGVVREFPSYDRLRYDEPRLSFLSLSLSLSTFYRVREGRSRVEFSKEEGGRDERGREGRTIIDGAVKSERRESVIVEVGDRWG